MRIRPRVLAGTVILVLVGLTAMVASGAVLPRVSAAPPRQPPAGSVTIVSASPSETTLLSDSVLDPSPLWRSPTFDDGGWQGSYPAATLPAWGAPVGGTTSADFVWGGLPGAPVGGRYNIPLSPDPQFLFLRDNFCVPINADVTTVQATTPLRIQVAASPGNASVYYNSVDIALNLPGQEDGSFHTVTLNPTLVDPVRRVGRNTLAIRVHDDVDDAYAALAYHLEFAYTIDPAAITLNANPPSGTAVAGDPVIFSQGNTGLSGDGPYTFDWDFGDGTTSTDPNPSKVYAAAGTYTVTLIMADRFGCPSSPVSMPYVVIEPTPTLTPSPTASSTPTATDTPAPPADTPAPPSPSQPTSTPVSSPTPALTPTATIPLFLPETGDGVQPSGVNFAFSLVGGLLLVISYLLFRHRLACRD